jgi:hypothetical protein
MELCKAMRQLRLTKARTAILEFIAPSECGDLAEQTEASLLKMAAMAADLDAIEETIRPQIAEFGITTQIVSEETLPDHAKFEEYLQILQLLTNAFVANAANGPDQAVFEDLVKTTCEIVTSQYTDNVMAV